ncbi:RHS repeat-associated core domain-containing protein [Flavobacterium sp. WV_118_3]|uniref:RHS repeat-associated core domain-containing protein n=1 Tax=Flavobacterium sp. WV_118_3 TaxID=3151764 RepID=UPI00321A0A9D
MDYRNTRYSGIKKNVFQTVHYIVLIGMLHSTFVAPAQGILEAYFKPSNIQYYAGSMAKKHPERLFGNSDTTTLSNQVGQIKTEPIRVSDDISTVKTVTTAVKQWVADIPSGIIGSTKEMPMDSPSDNVFKFNIDALPDSRDYNVYLKYDVYGVDGVNAVSRSINDRLATGGYIVKETKNWSQQKEEIDGDWLKNGENKVVFATPERSTYQYSIKNVTIAVEKKKPLEIAPTVVVHNSDITLSKDNKIYIKGFLKGKEEAIAKVTANGKALRYTNGEFEGFIELSDRIKKDQLVVIKAEDEEGLIGQELLTVGYLLEADQYFEIEKTKDFITNRFEAYKGGMFAISGAKITVPDSALVKSRLVSIRELRKIDIVPLGSGLINVTKGGKAYRFLPDGTKFEKPVKIALEYDSLLIPKGYTAADIKTFYFDTQQKRWIEVQRDQVDTEAKSIVSETTHFTDYINGIIQVPESPQSTAFAPTMMNDIKAADPSAEITMMSPPQASYDGNANVSYPIKIPAGRKGMQPNLAVQYSSESKGGWLGEGWNISVPAITLDTRWGVPLFDVQKETEIYTLAGEQLMYPKMANGEDYMPNRHMDAGTASNGSTVYSTEKQLRSYALSANKKAFSFRKKTDNTLVERFGSTPANYFWKVTATDGTVSWYGGKDGAIVDNAVIKNDNNNIVHWALYMTEDVNGNRIKYVYDNFNLGVQSGDNAILTGGRVFNIKNIYYTGKGGDDGKYRVDFTNETNVIRPDVSVNNRLGIKQINVYRLKKIDVLYNTASIRSYDFVYAIGKFNKSLLKTITEKDATGQIAYSHNLMYYDDLENTNLFNQGVKVQVPEIAPNYQLSFGNMLNASKMNSSQNVDKGWEVEPSLGIQLRFWSISQNPSPTFMFGFPFGESTTKEVGKVTLVDIDGDGLEDVVYQKSDGLWYLGHKVRDYDTTEHYFDSAKKINKAGEFFRSEGTSKNKFLEGWNFKFQLFGAPFFFGTKRFKSSSETITYFTDANHDGLIDIVSNGVVYFNRLDSNETPTFYASSELTPNMVITADPGIRPNEEPDPDDQQMDVMTDYDVVRVWVSPASGHVIIRDRISLQGNNPEDKAVYSIEVLGGRNIGYRLYLKELTAAQPPVDVLITDDNVPLGADFLNNNGVLAVDKNVKFYFRLHKNTNGSNAVLNSNPSIEFVDEFGVPMGPLLDPNGIDNNRSNYADSFILSKEDETELPGTGTVKFEWSNFTVANMSDDVTYKIVKYTYDLTNLQAQPLEEVIYQKICPQNSSTVVSMAGNTMAIDVSNYVMSNLSNNQQVVFKLFVESDSNVKWKAIEWKPKFTYIPDANAITGGVVNRSVYKYPIVKYSIYRGYTSKYRLGPNHNNVYGRPIIWNVPNTVQTYGLKINNMLESNPAYPFTNEDNGSFLMVVKKNGKYIAKRKITIQNGTVNVSNNNDPIPLYTGNINSIATPVDINVEFYVDGAQNDELFVKWRGLVQSHYESYIAPDGVTIVTTYKDRGSLIYIGYDWSLPYQTGSYYNREVPYSAYYTSKSYGNSQYQYWGEIFRYSLEHLGSLHNGWGQFLYNENHDPNPNTRSDSYGKLLNHSVIANPMLGMSTDILADMGIDTSQCDNAPDPGACIQGVLTSAFNLPNENTDFSQYSIQDLQALGDLLNQFSINPPAICLLEAKPTRNVNENNQMIEKWEGFFDTTYSSATTMRAGDFTTSSFGDMFNEDDSHTHFTEQADMNTGMFAINKQHQSASRSYTVGWGPINFSRSSLNDEGYSQSTREFMDLNGDGYPEIFLTDNLQTTTMTGGHRSPSGDPGFGHISVSHSENNGFTLAKGSIIAGNKSTGSDSNSDSNGRGGEEKRAMNIGKPSDRIGVSVSLDGDNHGENFWQDVNGDGLPDRINIDGNVFRVQLNKGTIGQTVFENANYRNLTSYMSTPSPLGVSLGFSIDGMVSGLLQSVPLEFSIDIGASRNGNNTRVTFEDVNNDGLVDIITSNGVRFNEGTRFSDTVYPITVNLNNDSQSTALSIAGQVAMFSHFTICCKFLFVYFPILHFKWGASVGGNANLAITENLKSYRDFNKDGFTDMVAKDGGDFIVYHSNIKRTNLLKTVQNPLGGTFTVDYTPKPVDYNNPHSRWVMSGLVIHDGKTLANEGVDIYRKSFEYERGRYDRREREFYGYGIVRTLDYKPNEQAYRTTIAEYHNDNYFLKGLVKKSYVKKGPYYGTASGPVFSQMENFYELRKILANGQMDTNSSLPLTFDVGGKEGRRQAGVVMVKTRNEVYELGTNTIVSESRMKYDGYGRVTDYINDGDLATTADNYSSTVSYHNDAVLVAKNILNVPKEIKVFDSSSGSSVLKRRRITDEINPNTGAIGAILAYKDAGSFVKTTMEYDGFGNLTRVEFPRNHNNQAFWYMYGYDTATNKYVTQIDDAFGYYSTTEYDPKFDKVLETIDIGGSIAQYQYDTFGRLVTVKGPKELVAAISDYTIKFKYYPTHADLGANPCVSSTDFLPVAVTTHYDEQHDPNAIETFTFMDGLGRPMQVKKDIEINTGTIDKPVYEEAMSVSGWVYYDDYGRGIRQYNPTYEGKSCAVNYKINQQVVPYFSKTEYDELDRVVKTTDQDGKEATMTYTVDTDQNGSMALKTRSVTDQNGSQEVISEIFKDINGRVNMTKNVGPSGDIWTKFNYNGIGELLAYVDAEDLTTTYDYDDLGRKTEVTHPDNGTTKYAYDNAGNLTKLETANLTNAGTAISYEYEYNRPIKIKFPPTASGVNISDVTYKYGNGGPVTGRLVYQKDASGEQHFDYGSMGELIYNKRTVVGPNIPTRVFETYFEYDSWNRLKKMTYPDGERVSYYYDLGGNLNRVLGNVASTDYEYIQRIDYDHYEQRTYLLYGNNTETKYTYSPSLRRLSNLNVKTAAQQNMFNNNYAYDNVGNVRTISNNAPYNPTNQLGGTYEHTFKYDNLNRLTSGRGSFIGFVNRETNNNSDYSSDMEYNDTHGIKVKNQTHAVNSYLTNPDNTYSNNYEYISGSHRVKSIVDSNTGNMEDFKYDLNGNMTVRSTSVGMNTSMYWDESNRLRVVDKDGQMQHYIYDAIGERILKGTSRVEQVFENGTLVNGSGVSFEAYTTYPSAYVVVDGRGEYSKHYYAGAQRIVSRIGESDASIFERLDKTELDIKKLQLAQKTDLEQMVSKSDNGKVYFKDYKPEILTKEKDGEELESERASQVTEQFPYTDIYYYHPDHLGSSTYLTDANGMPYQFFLNLPFGETMVEMHSFTENYASPYKFNGKELDSETGMYYYGARYYDPKISIWLSVDPLAQNYQGWNPYNYTMQNPINLIDPDGMQSVDPPGFFKRIGDWFKSTFKGAKETGYQEIEKTNDVAYTVNLNDIVVQRNKETIPCNTCHHNSQLNPSILSGFSFLRDIFDRQSGYVQMDGEMKTDFLGDNPGKKGVIYNAVESPWAPGPTLYATKFSKVLEDIKLFADLFSTEMEMTGIMKNRNDKDVQFKTFIYSDTVRLKTNRFDDFGGFGGTVNGYKIKEKKGYMFINGKDTLKLK